jgi:hypothetical protein
MSLIEFAASSIPLELAEINTPAGFCTLPNAILFFSA